jgi:hypothetical protein
MTVWWSWSLMYLCQWVDLDIWFYLTLTPLYVLLAAGGGADERLTQAPTLKISWTPYILFSPILSYLISSYFNLADLAEPYFALLCFAWFDCVWSHLWCLICLYQFLSFLINFTTIINPHQSSSIPQIISFLQASHQTRSIHQFHQFHNNHQIHAMHINCIKSIMNHWRID